MATIEEILDEVENAAGKNEKRAILTKHLVFQRAPEFAQMLKLVFDPTVTFGIKKVAATGVNGGPNIDWNLFKFLLEELRDRKLVGKEATFQVNQYIGSLNQNSAMWATRIVKKNLRAGFSDETVEKIDPTLVKTFKIPLAERFEEVPNDFLNREFSVQPKLDGVRCVTIVRDFTPQGVKFFSRSGLEWINPNFDVIKPEIAKKLEDYSKTNKVTLPMYLDGEIVVMSDDGIPDWNAIQHVMNADKVVPEGALIQYIVFDMATEAQWDNPTLPYSQRIKDVDTIIGFGGKVSAILHSPRKCPTREDMIKACNDFMVLGYEGAIYRSLKDAPSNKRARSLIKVKTFFDDEATLIGGKMGEGRLAFGIGALEVRHKNGKIFEVGSGISDYRRGWLAANLEQLKGSLIKFRYQQLSEDGIPRFPTFKGIRSKEDV